MVLMTWKSMDKGPPYAKAWTRINAAIGYRLKSQPSLAHGSTTKTRSGGAQRGCIQQSANLNLPWKWQTLILNGHLI